MKSQINVSLDVEIVEKLHKMKETESLNISSLINGLLIEYLNKVEFQRSKFGIVQA